MIDISVTLTVNNRDEYNRVLEFAKPSEEAETGAYFSTNPEALSFSWSGADGRSRASAIAEEVAEHFTDIVFHICWHCIDTDDFDFGVAENGVIKRLEMSREMRETINEMLHYGVDVDPYIGPTSENYHQLQLCRWDEAMEEVKSGGNLLKTASLQVKDLDEFRRVLEYVKPDESDTAPQDREEYGQVTDYVATLSGAERCAWMTRHCKRLNVEFGVDAGKQTLSWSGYYAMGDWAKEILDLVVAQFPEIEFRVSVLGDPHGQYSLDFGISERGKIKWLDVSYDVEEMFRLGIDVDPYAGPTPESLRQLKVHRWNRTIEEIKEVRWPHFVSLQVENHDEYLRVLEFVTPDESDRNPRDGEECAQVNDYLETLSGTERCAWMTRHCARLFMSFDKNEEKLQLLWSDPGVFDALVFEIARLVVAQFPDINFRICVNYYEARFAQSENGHIKWLELSREEEQRMLEDVRDSINSLNGDYNDIPF
jgi:hypothetical protein